MNATRLQIRWVFLVVFTTVAFALSAAEPREFLVEPIPDWATSAEIKDHNNPLEKEASAGVFFLLFNVEVNGATRERFVHLAEKFTSSAGVEANSRLSFVFDPSYQQLVIHKIVIHRGDQVLNQLEPSKIRVIQQERELDRLIYNGAKTALLFLEDVRVGDWVEFAYTVRGRNPIEAGHFFDSIQLRYPFPIQTENYRLLWPVTNQPLWMQIVGNAPNNRRNTDQFYEYAWHWKDRRGEEIEDFLPPFLFQYTLVHFSDFKTWADVANWAGQSFRPEKVTDELYQKIMRIRDENATDEQRILKALQFVQDDIRYLGIENGINSHQPTDPSVVFARRYGDCKDKALLLWTMLRFFEKVDASPVLVSSRLQGATKNLIATPLLFDHAIVQIILNGKTNFVDVTRSYQRGPLDRRFVDYFGAGVLLEENSPGLITIPATDAGRPKTRIEESFDVATNGATELVVTSTFEGRDADFVRQGRASASQEAIDKNALAFYHKYYEAIYATGRPETHDDEQSDRIRVTRRYFIPNIWKPALRTNFIACEFASHGIFDRLYIPARKERKRPLAVSFPENFIHTLRIKTHEPLRIIPKEKKIQTKAFLFHNKTTYTNSEVEVTCQILALNRAVAAADMPEYWTALDEIPRFLGFTMTKPAAGAGRNDSPNWSIWMAGISYSIVLLIAAAVAYHHKPKSPPQLPVPSHPDLIGLRGWLILLGIGLIVAPFLRVHFLFKTGAAYSTSNWRAITDSAGSEYDPMLAPILLFELFSQITFLFFSILLIASYFQKKRIFPILFIVYLSFQFIVSTLDQVLMESRTVKTVTANVHQSVARSVGQTLVPLVAWGLYVARSRRVKVTFVN